MIILQTSPSRLPPTKHPKRLSSTPKKMPPVDQQENHEGTFSPSTQPAPAVDRSLEEALLDRSNFSEPTLSGVSAAVLPSPKMSRVDVDTSRKFPLGKPSSLRLPGKEKKNRQGLAVSFVQNGTDKDSSSKKKKFTRHATQRNLGESLVNSLNSSRYGAMDRKYEQTRKEGSFPRRGDDLRLGYDWIAGLLDSSKSYLSERDDEYFEEMKQFRRVNFAECHRPKEIE